MPEAFLFKIPLMTIMTKAWRRTFGSQRSVRTYCGYILPELGVKALTFEEELF